MAERVVSDLGAVPVAEVVVNKSYTFYGRSGTGKTTFAATFPGPILLLDASDQGTDSISDQDHVFVKKIDSWDDFELAYWYLMQHPDEYATVVIDTVSQVQNFALIKVLEDKGKDSDNAGEWGVMSKRDWGQVASIMKEYITRYRDLPVETIFIAQDRTFNIDDEADPETMIEPEIGPQLIPSVCKHLNAAVHVIGNTFIRTRYEQKKVRVKKGNKTQVKVKEQEVIEFCLRVGPNPVYITKVRKPKTVKLPSVIVDPSYGDLQAIIKGEV